MEILFFSSFYPIDVFSCDTILMPTIVFDLFSIVNAQQSIYGTTEILKIKVFFRDGMYLLFNITLLKLDHHRTYFLSFNKTLKLENTS